MSDLFRKVKSYPTLLKKKKFDNFVTVSKKVCENTSNKKLQDATDISLFQKNINVG